MSNTYPTYPLQSDSLSKERLIQYVPAFPHEDAGKDLSVKDGDAFH